MVLNQVYMQAQQGAPLHLELGPRAPPRGLQLSLATRIPAGPGQQCIGLDLDAFDDSPWSGIETRHLADLSGQAPPPAVLAPPPPPQSGSKTSSNSRARRRANAGAAARSGGGRMQTPATGASPEVADDGAPRWPDGPWPQGFTTAMLRNTPNRYTAEELLAEMIGLGFEGAFDFFYLPIDFITKRNRGFCFVNFVSASRAADFAAAFHGLSLQRYATHKILQVSPALTQGFEANVEQYARKDAQRIQNPWFRPMIFRDLAEVPENPVDEAHDD